MLRKVGEHDFISHPNGVLELASKGHTVLTISDLHAPFQHRNALRFLRWLAEEYRPTVVVCLGDEFDMGFWSFHDKDSHMPGGKDEYHSALEFMGQLYALFPSVLCCTSNHTSRPYRVGFKYGLISDFMRSYHEITQAPPTWCYSDRFIIDNVVYEHGENVSGRNAAWQAASQNRMSTVIGHIHGHGSVQYSASPFNQMFAMNAGCLIDTEALAFRYGAKYRNKATIGTGVVMKGDDAHFIKMPKEWL